MGFSLTSVSSVPCVNGRRTSRPSAREILFDPAVLQMHLASGVGRDVRLVGHQDDGLPVLEELLEEREDLFARGAVEVTGRLVGEEDAGRVHQRAGDRDALPLAAGELVRPVLHAVGEADASERVRGLYPSILCPETRVDQRQLDIIERRGAGQQVEGLKDEADLLVSDAGELVVVEVGHPMAVEPVLPGGRAVEAADQIHQGGLARSRRPHHRDELVFPNGQIDTAERVHDLTAHIVVPLQTVA